MLKWNASDQFQRLYRVPVSNRACHGNGESQGYAFPCGFQASGKGVHHATDPLHSLLAEDAEEIPAPDYDPQLLDKRVRKQGIPGVFH